MGAAAVIAAIALAAGGCSDDAGGPAPTTSSGGAPTTTGGTPPSATSSTVVPPTSVPPTTAPPATSAPPTVTASTTSGIVPARVTEVRAGPGGGSGEVSVLWRGVPGATTYVVERAAAVTGPFARAGELDVATGAAERGPGVVNLYAVGDGTFVLVDVVTELTNGGVQRWYRVVARGPGGAAAPSPVVCGAPPGAPGC